jgi:hypothetical protein
MAYHMATMHAKALQPLQIEPSTVTEPSAVKMHAMQQPLTLAGAMTH